MHALWLVNASAGSQVLGLFFGLSEVSRRDIELRVRPQKALQISVVAPTGVGSQASLFEIAFAGLALAA